MYMFKTFVSLLSTHATYFLNIYSQWRCVFGCTPCPLFSCVSGDK